VTDDTADPRRSHVLTEDGRMDQPQAFDRPPPSIALPAVHAPGRRQRQMPTEDPGMPDGDGRSTVPTKPDSSQIEVVGMSAHFEVYKDKAGQWRFRLKAANGETVASGESYPTEANAERGCEAVKRAAAEADIKVVAA
jgi:uncharacterized protein YegP (UPF0339 family)